MHGLPNGHAGSVKLGSLMTHNEQNTAPSFSTKTKNLLGLLFHGSLENGKELGRKKSPDI
jgi:hypothetical protein